MKWMKWIGIAAAILLVISCFTTWVIIPSKNLVVTGVDAPGTNYGRPGYFNLLMTLFFVIFTLIPRIWAKRMNLLVAALNLAWTVRNYFVITACLAGECPEKHSGIFLLIVASVGMLVSSLFPDVRLPDQTSVPDNKT
jgi:hypothetical protein